MDIAEIRKLRRADPFQPFTLVLADGRRLPVEVPYRLGISPLGNEMAYASPTNGAVFLRPSQVQDLEFGISADPTGGVPA